MILFFATSDWANVGYTYSQALRSVGVKAKALALYPEVFSYPKQAEIYSSFERMEKLVRGADMVIFMHSDDHFMKLPFNLEGTRLGVFHGGTRYRFAPGLYNSVWNPVVEFSIIQTGDLLDLGAKNQLWVLPGLDMNKIKPKAAIKDKKGRIKFAHFPNKPSIKGTMYIENAVQKALRKAKFIWTCDEERTFDWKANLDRMAQCDVYIEACMPNQPQIGTGKEFPYGEWGVQGLEAAALGKVVITHFRSHERYEKEYGPCPLLWANSEREVKKRIEECCAMGYEGVRELGKKTRKWAEKYHSYEAVGARLKKLLEL
jgi:hypothetical protein